MPKGHWKCIGNIALGKVVFLEVNMIIFPLWQFFEKLFVNKSSMAKWWLLQPFATILIFNQRLNFWIAECGKCGFGRSLHNRATLMLVYHCYKPVLWSKWPLASSFKFATSHKIMSQSMPTWLFNAFFIRMNPWKFGE